MNFDLRNSSEDQSQRMLNALEPGTVMPIHRHRKSSETVVVLRGKVRWNYYNDKGEIIETFVVAPCSEMVGINIPAGQWHSLECMESGTVMMMCKDGVWEALGEEDMMIKGSWDP